MEKILIVEDNPGLQELYNEVLLDKGYQVIMVDNGQEGFSKLQKHNPQLVILDIGVPKLNGLDFLSQMRKLKYDTPVFVITGKSGMREDPEINLCKQVKVFLEKPVSILELMVKVKGILGEQNRISENKAEIKGLKDKLIKAGPEFLIGSCLCNCKLTQILGSGGSGIAYKAKHLGLNIDVVIKILHPEFEIMSEEVERFIREINILTQLKHENLVQIIDAGIYQDLFFITMPYIDGTTLEEEMFKFNYSPLSVAIPMIISICEGLKVVHKAKLVHRDIKPGNILITREKKKPIVLDFGLARDQNQKKKITHKGYVLGTPIYMAPEQCFGLVSDIRTDIYNLGVTFYHLITGQVPFMKESAMATMMAHAGENPTPPYKIQSHIPREISDVIMQMMEKEPDHRYQNMQQVIDSLKNINS